MKIDWSKVDWKRQDIEIAHGLGCSREAVRQARPEGSVADHPRQRTIPTALARLKAMDTSKMTLEQAGGLAMCEPRHAGRILRKLGKTYVRKPKGNSKHDWGRFPANWKSLTDKEIAMVVGVEDPAVVAQWRNRHGYRKQAPEAVPAGKAVAS